MRWWQAVRLARWVGALAFLGACTGGKGDPGRGDSGGENTGGEDTGGEDTGEPGTHRFSFAVIADGHVTGPGDHLDRLEAALAWIDAQAASRQIEVTLVLGDIAWSGGLSVVPPILLAQAVPTVPILGDNEIQGGDEQAYHLAYADNYADLAGRLDGWSYGVEAVDNPDYADTQSWFQNQAFEVQGVRFLGLDWNSRDTETVFGETPDLHDFDGGTWPWFQDRVEAEQGADEGVVMASHMPMFLGPGGFSTEEWAQVVELSGGRVGALSANFGGHFHGNSEDTADDAGFDIFVTDATWDDEITVRVVEVWSDGLHYSYVHELIEVD